MDILLSSDQAFKLGRVTRKGLKKTQKITLKLIRIAVKSAGLLLVVPLLFSQQPQSRVASYTPSVQFVQDTQIEKKELDSRAKILRDYLARYNSPLQNHAQDFIDAADSFNLDWKLVPAITGVESTFGKHIPGGHNPATSSYNGWGWGVYGNKVTKFKSWREGIFTVSEGLKKNYIDQGLTDPYTINKKYAASPNWGRKVTYFLEDLERFASNYQQSSTLQPLKIEPLREEKTKVMVNPLVINYFEFSL